MNPIYCSIKELAKISGLSYYFISNMIKSGELKAVKSGTKYFIDVEYFKSVLKSKEQFS